MADDKMINKGCIIPMATAISTFFLLWLISEGDYFYHLRGIMDGKHLGFDEILALLALIVSVVLWIASYISFRKLIKPESQLKKTNEQNKIDNMDDRREIKVKKKDIRNVILIIFAPLLVTFVLEHLGDFNYKGYGGVSILEFEASNIEFETFFGNVIEENVEGQGIGYNRKDDGGYELGKYSDKLPYMIRAVFSVDFIYPFIAITIGLGIYALRKKFNVKIT